MIDKKYLDDTIIINPKQVSTNKIHGIYTIYVSSFPNLKKIVVDNVKVETLKLINSSQTGRERDIELEVTKTGFVGRILFDKSITLI